MKILPILTVLFTAHFLHAREAAKPEPQAPSEPAKARKANPPKAKKESYPADMPKPTHAGVKYGPHPRHVFDFWQAKSDQPTPLVLVIHGGGWNAGSKESANRIANVKALLDAGISVAANNYRYVPQAVAEGVTPPVKAPMDEEMVPVKALLYKASICRAVKRPNDDGMAPVNLLPCRFNASRSVRSPKKEGMVPVSRFSNNARTASMFKAPN